MNRLLFACRGFWFIVANKEISVKLRNNDRELILETGCYADNARFLSSLKQRDSVPDAVLKQYKDLLDTASVKS